MTRSSTANDTAYYPGWDAIRDLPSMPGTVAIQRDIMADLDTPVSAFLKIREGSLSFLLESVEGGERVGRYSFIGNGSWRWDLEPPPSDQATAPSAAGISPAGYQALRERLDAMRPAFPSEDARFDGGAIGYLAYEAIHHVERIPASGRDVLHVPDGIFMGVETLLVFDHLRHTIRVISHMRLNEPREVAYAQAVDRIDTLVARLREAVSEEAYADSPRTGVGSIAQPRSNVSPKEFADMVVKAKEYIKAGDIYQVVLSQRLTIPLSGEPFTLYRALRTVSPSPYMYFLDFGDHQVVGASPSFSCR